MRREDPINAYADRHASVVPVQLSRGEDVLRGAVYVDGGWDRLRPQDHVARLRGIVEEYADDPRMRWTVANMLQKAGIPTREYKKQAAYLLRWVQDKIYYTNEPGEQIQSPWRTLAVATGDCDDMAVLLACMYDSIALPWKFVLAGRVDGKAARWVEGERFPWGFEVSHIYVMVGTPPFNPREWYSAEPTVRGLPLGHDVVLHGIPPGVPMGDDLPAGQGMPGAANGSRAPSVRPIPANAPVIRADTQTPPALLHAIRANATSPVSDVLLREVGRMAGPMGLSPATRAIATTTALMQDEDAATQLDANAPWWRRMLAQIDQPAILNATVQAIVVSLALGAVEAIRRKRGKKQ
jgi:hypothetical protein